MSSNAYINQLSYQYKIPEHLARELADKIIQQTNAIKMQEEKVRSARDLTFEQWLETENSNPDFRWDFSWQKYIRNYLELIIHGDIHQIVFNLPPRVGKSEMVSVRFPVYWMERNPRDGIILGAYGRELAVEFSMKAMRIYESRNPGDLSTESQDEWKNVHGGFMKPVGVGSGITGRGGSLLLIDDPVKSFQEAMSKAYMDRVWNWWLFDLRTRRNWMDKTPTIVTMTRWSVDDLTGRIFNSENAKDWVHVCIPAIAETEDPLGRLVGESILPDRMPAESILKMIADDVIGGSGLYQQKPLQVSASSINTEKLTYVDEVPRRAHRVLYWDRAASQGKGDFTVGVLMAMDDDGLFYVEDVIRGQWDDLVVQQKMREAAEIYAQLYGGYKNNVPDNEEIEDAIEDVLEDLYDANLRADDQVDSTFYGFQRAHPERLQEALEKLKSLYGNGRQPLPPQRPAAASTGPMEAENDLSDYIMQFWFEQEPGSAGKATALHALRTVLVGFEAYIDKPTENKAVRGRPFVAAVNAGNVFLKKAPWNQAYVNELRLYVMGIKNQRDDQFDGSTGSFNKLAVERRRLTMS